MLCIAEGVAFALGFTFFFFQAEDGIRDLVRSRGLGDVYKRQVDWRSDQYSLGCILYEMLTREIPFDGKGAFEIMYCLLYTSDAADERSSVDLGGRRIIKKKTLVKIQATDRHLRNTKTEEHKREKHKQQPQNK